MSQYSLCTKEEKFKTSFIWILLVLAAIVVLLISCLGSGVSGNAEADQIKANCLKAANDEQSQNAISYMSFEVPRGYRMIEFNHYLSNQSSGNNFVLINLRIWVFYDHPQASPKKCIESFKANVLSSVVSIEQSLLEENVDIASQQGVWASVSGHSKLSAKAPYTAQFWSFSWKDWIYMIHLEADGIIDQESFAKISREIKSSIQLYE